MSRRLSPWLASVLLLVAGSHATGCWSVPADPGENARLRTRRSTPSQAPAVAARATPGGSGGEAGRAEGVDPAAESIYYSKCSQCHEAYPPGMFSAGEWPLYVDRYGPRAGLFGAERASVLRWLQANAR
jgi:cytochrome c5